MTSALGLAHGVVGCAPAGAEPLVPATADRAPIRVEPAVPADASPSASADAGRDAGEVDASANAQAAPTSPAADAIATPLREPREVAIGAGRSRHRIELPAGERFVSIGVLGEPADLLGFELVAPPAFGDLRANESLAEDGKLPRFASFVSRGQGAVVEVLADVRAPARLLVGWVDPADRATPDPRALRTGSAPARPLVGLPMPTDERDGYVLETPQRYLFLRVDVAVALREALRQTRIRFRRGPIGLGHASEWDGTGPGTDQGKSMHIGHRGGREIDVGLPSSDDSPSSITRRCQGVLVERTVLRCEPGTVRDLDAMRLAYFLGLLIDGPTPNGVHMPKGRPGPTALVDSILTDEAYMEEIRKAARELRRKNWIHDEGFAALMEDGILRPSPWHTDHVHLRFAGEDGRVVIGGSGPNGDGATGSDP